MRMILSAMLMLAVSRADAESASKSVDFERDVKPILSAKCFSCHGVEKQSGGLRLDRRADALKGGEQGPALKPGKSDESPMFRLAAGLDPSQPMPAEGKPLAATELRVIREWIDAGAVWPEAAPPIVKAQHWAFQPLHRPPPPKIRCKQWARSPIDAFVLAKLESHGFSPAPPADRRTLLRRWTIDLTGLSPTPEETAAFLADNAPDAERRVLDRLLASPRYGERQARRWMDVARYAETHGHDQDRIRPNAWPYRDYLIQSFNADIPYGRFVAEQVAGDVLEPDDPQGIVATGFLAAGPWDESALLNIAEDSVDRTIAQYLDRDEMLQATFGAFCGLTVGCARCHDHKFDPVSQAEYYGLQAVFAGIDRAERPFDADPVVARQRTTLQRRLQELERGATPDPAASAAALADLEKERKAPAVVWTVLEPRSISTTGGATSRTLPDRSVLFGGKRPDRDAYTLTFRAKLCDLSALRIETLADPSLPKQGPGRADNGNFHLSEVRLRAASTREPGRWRSVSLQNPSADFNQAGWTIVHSLDKNLQTAWGIFPKVGQPHHAVFELAGPLESSGELLLELTLEQQHGGSHLIGRVRVSATNVARPVRAEPTSVSDSLAAILATPSARWTPAQRAELSRWLLQRNWQRELSALPAPSKVYAAAADFPADNNFRPARGCRPIHLLRRGDVRTPMTAATPGALACVPGLSPRFSLHAPSDEGERRAALALWLASPANVLTWRTMANRIWQWHFGRGIVDSPNDLGAMGGVPSHPELLDFLACTLRDGGSLKEMHRLILTSNAYRQSSAWRAELARVDADNKLLGRMNLLRLDAETVHDSLLQATGKLDLTMGGPSARLFIERPGVHVAPVVDYTSFDPDRNENFRRSVYRLTFRTLPDPWMEALECPDGAQSTPVRPGSVTVQQALAMWNNRFVLRQCEHLAARLRRERPTATGQIDRLIKLVLGRSAEPAERTALTTYAASHGLPNACRVVLNSNEFLFIP